MATTVHYGSRPQHLSGHKEALATRGCYSSLWQQAKTFERSQRSSCNLWLLQFIMRADTTFERSQRSSHNPWLLFIMTAGHNIWEVTKKLSQHVAATVQYNSRPQHLRGHKLALVTRGYYSSLWQQATTFERSQRSSRNPWMLQFIMTLYCIPVHLGPLHQSWHIICWA